MTNEKKTDSKKFNVLARINGYLTLLLVIIGLLIVFITLYFKPDNLDTTDEIEKLAFSFFELLGFTLFTSGIFTFLLQLPDWRKYFEERLQSIVLEQEYLNTLDGTSLSNLQVKTLKAYYHSSDIDKEGSFLKHFQDNISQFISKPFREDVISEINFIEEVVDGYILGDRMTYCCRMVDGKIQQSIDWQPEVNEFIDIFDVTIKIRKNCESEFKKVKSFLKIEDKYFIDDQTQETNLDDFFKNGISFPLKNYNEDKLDVEISAKYKIKKGIFCTWQMAHPTKKIFITIHYPESYYVFFQAFLPDDKRPIKSDGNGLYSMKYDEWLMPNSGIAFSFVHAD